MLFLFINLHNGILYNALSTGVRMPRKFSFTHPKNGQLKKKRETMNKDNTSAEVRLNVICECF